MKSEKVRRWRASVPEADEQYAAKRRVLIREAGRAFSRNGFHNTSLDEVARSLGVSKTALYRYITDKNEILYECHNLALEAGEVILAKIQAEKVSPLQTLRLFVIGFVSFLNSDLGSYAVLGEPLTSLRERERRLIRARRRKFDTALRLILTEAIQAGEIPERDPGLAVAFFMGAINSVPRWFDPSGRIAGHEVARVFSEFTVSLLQGDAGHQN
ncbi:TetR/AcrR family transcriptional regulator [Bradyrhizobium genosp. SA-3]|uniref:TetR/AcrR family transcriptional regulator n=1 Tax=Bradyrhizobium genosp. SA-3 TaxID=508868 RepID=UPI00102A8D6C|nr:TetR/AcrR family transcriptional regulator [Bradyrhizobium genosp. SA-3]RZN03722.1 TetR/AcrR family transcriptional regulator [Bradyrhizobium genosp. SA-3]